MSRSRDELDRVVPVLADIQRQQAEAYQNKYHYYASLLQQNDYLELFSHLDGGNSPRGESLHQAIKLTMATEARDGETQARDRLFLLLYGTSWGEYSQRLAEEAEARKTQAERQARWDRLNSGMPVHPVVLDRMLSAGECTLQDEAVKELIEFYLDHLEEQPAYKAWVVRHVPGARGTPPIEQDTARQEQNMGVFKSVTSGTGHPDDHHHSNGTVKVRYTGGSVGFSIRDATGTDVKVMKDEVYHVSRETWQNLREFSPRDWRLA